MTTKRVRGRSMEAPVSGTSLSAVAVGDMPLTSRALFWKPRSVQGSRSVVHLPFLFWVVETLRPTCAVQIGLEDGGSYLGLCQAVEKCGLEAVCMGFEADAEAPAFQKDCRAQHDALYGDISFIAPEDITRPAAYLPTGEIDLLVLDLALTAEVVESLQQNWLPHLSDRAVILLHAPQSRLVSDEARVLFGDWKRQHPSISFPQAKPGLEVILHGAQPVERIARLAELRMGMSGYMMAHQVFTRLGQGLLAEQQMQAAEGALAREEALKTELAQERGLKASALSTQAAYLAQIADLQLQVFDARKATEESPAFLLLQDELAALKSQMTALHESHAQQQARITSLTDENTQLRAAQDEVKAVAADPLLASQLEDLAAHNTTLEEEILRLRKQVKDARDRRLALWENQERLRTENTVLMARAKTAPIDPQK